MSLPPLSREDSQLLAKRRRGKNIAMLVALVLICVLFYAISIVKLSGKMGLHG